MRVQRVGDSAKDRNRRIALAPLYGAQVTEVQACTERKLLLRHAASLPKLADGSSDDNFPIHIKIGASVAVFGLGHICPLAFSVSA